MRTRYVTYTTHVWVTVWLSLAVLAATALPAYGQQAPPAGPAMAATAMAVHVQQSPDPAPQAQQAAPGPMWSRSAAVAVLGDAAAEPLFDPLPATTAGTAPVGAAPTP